MTGELETHGEGRRDSTTVPLLLLRTSVVLAFVALGVAFWSLQVGQHDRYHQLAENNHRRTVGLRAPRGNVFDRDGRILVKNRNSLNISFVREQVADLERTITLLSEVAGVPSAALWSVVERNRRTPAYQPMVLIRDATMGQVSAVAAHALELAGLFVQELPARHYETAEVAAHLFGYVGQVSDSQLGTADFEGRAQRHGRGEVWHREHIQPAAHGNRRCPPGGGRRDRSRDRHRW